MVEALMPGLIPHVIRVITVYDGNELDDDGVNQPAGDYTSVEVWFDLTLVVKFGDHYHDQGHIKADAFIAGATHAWKVAYDLTAPNTFYVDRYPCVGDNK